MQYLIFRLVAVAPAEDEFHLWKEISGRDTYSPWVDETDNNVSVVSGLNNPFPYCTGDSQTIGNYLGAIGQIIKALALKPGEKIIEFGTG